MKYQYRNAKGDERIIECSMRSPPPETIAFSTTPDGDTVFTRCDPDDPDAFRRVYEGDIKGHVRWQDLVNPPRDLKFKPGAV